MTDAGSENVNQDVDDELSGANLRRVLAQIDVTYSNSMIEAFWRSLKNSWLYLHGLESESELRRLIAIYAQAHNEVIPRSMGRLRMRFTLGTVVRSLRSFQRAGLGLRMHE